MTRPQTTVEITEELLPDAVLDEQIQERKERTYTEKTVEKDSRLDFLDGLEEPNKEDNVF